MNKVNKAPAFQLYAGDFMTDTADYSCEELGAFFRLICHQWINGYIPSDLKRAARIAKITFKKISNQWKVYGHKFESISDGKLANPRLEECRKDRRNWLTRQSDAGKKGAEAKWSKPIPTPSPSPSLTPSQKDDSSSSSSTSYKTKSKSSANADSRHSPIREHIKKCFKASLGHEQWGVRDAKQLKNWLDSNPEVSIESAIEMVKNRFRSDLPRGDPAWKWLPELNSYLHGPLNEFKRVKVGNGNRADDTQRQNREAITAAVRASLASEADGFGAGEVPESESESSDGGGLAVGLVRASKALRP